MTSRNTTLAVTSSAVTTALASSAQAHTGADTGTLATLLHSWLHAAPAAGLALVGVALIGILLVRRKQASNR